MLSKLKILRIVNRFYNARQQHGNQRAQCWEYFGYLFYVAPSEDGLETTRSRTADSSNDHDQHQFILETSAYLGPIKLTNEEKLSTLSFWKRYRGTYPRLSQLARIYLTPNASSVQGWAYRISISTSILSTILL